MRLIRKRQNLSGEVLGEEGSPPNGVKGQGMVKKHFRMILIRKIL
jgi:hypothetical protein